MKLEKFLETIDIKQAPEPADSGEGDTAKTAVVKPPIKLLKTDAEKKNKTPQTIEVPKEINQYLSGEKVDIDFDSIIDDSIEKLKSLDNHDEEQLKKLEYFKSLNTEKRKTIYRLLRSPDIKTFDDFLNELQKAYAN